MSPLRNFASLTLDQLYIPFLVPLMDAVDACNQRGHHFFARSGYRTFKEQLFDWCKGRTTEGPKATDAGPGDSAHNYGLAVDFARIEGGVYLKKAEDYAVLGEEAEKRGLVWGGDFHHLKDGAHVQWPGYVTAEELAPLKTLYLKAELAPLSVVFAYLDTRPAPPGVGRPAGGAGQESPDSKPG